MFKKIWRGFLKRYKNSRLQAWVSSIFEKLKFEGFYVSYAQFGEDIILENLLRDVETGYFVDVGCNRPIEGNNTFKFYLKKWKGINIDGNRKMIDMFHKVRPKDTNICTLISNKDEEVDFHISEDDRVSSISADFVSEMKNTRDYTQTLRLKTEKLEHLLDKHHPQQLPFAFLSIDVEGHDLQVLESCEFVKYRPYIICIENHGFSISTLGENKIYDYLTQKNYHLAGFSKPNLYFMSNEGITA
jgi:FkbM family methyltransferase